MSTEQCWNDANGGKTEVLREKAVPVSCCPLHGPACDRTLTARDKARLINLTLDTVV